MTIAAWVFMSLGFVAGFVVWVLVTRKFWADEMTTSYSTPSIGDALSVIFLGLLAGLLTFMVVSALMFPAAWFVPAALVIVWLVAKRMVRKVDK